MRDFFGLQNPTSKTDGSPWGAVFFFSREILIFVFIYQQNMHFLESDIHFFFGSDWVVHRYDTHRYFKGLSGKGLKGVDFIGVLHQKSLVFFEIKNYNPRPSGKGGQSLKIVQQDSEILLHAFTKKIADTFTALDAIQQYWQRRSWRRIISAFVRHLPIKYSESSFWHKVIELAENPDCCTAVLWLESPAFDTGYRKKLSREISEALSGYCMRIILADSRSNPFSNTLSTQS
jgi:hypothetical protein